MLDHYPPMQDKHPIDDLFRATLGNAGIEPPAHLADAILGAVQRRRRAAAWHLRRYTIGAALLLTVGVTSFWYTTRSATHASKAESAAEPSRSTRTAAPVAPIIVKNDPQQQIATARRANSEDVVGGDPEQRVVYVGGQLAPAGGGNVQHEDQNMNVLLLPPVVFGVGRPVHVTEVENTIEPVRIERASLTLLTPMHQYASSLDAEPISAPAQSPYVLPNADWWVGGHAAVYASRYHWAGGDPELSDALNKAEAWTSTIGAGLLGGRTWRSGFGLSSGLELVRSEQAYQYTSKVVEQEHVIATEMVTLNTTVYYSASDTTVTETEHEQVYKGVDRRTVWRVPFELSWQENLGRWVLGARCGVAAEFTNARSSASLTVDGENGEIVAAPLSSGAVKERYPPDLVGMLGVDLGILVHERWTLLASPLYMRSLASFGDETALHGSSERTGVRFQARFIF